MAALWALILLQVASVAVAPLPGYYSQYGQDKYIMDHFFDEHYGPRQNRAGVFVEVGAGDGMHLSNTLAFEERFGWRGILIEPVLNAFEALRENRPNCTALHTCIAHTNQELLLVSNSEDGGLNSFLTTPSGLKNTSIVHDRLRCTSLSQVLSDFFHGSAGHVDYMSIDVEGNELSVLQSIDFNLYTIDVISVEVDLQDVNVHRFLTARRFRFLERLVDDAIYVYRRGFSPDPTCMLPNTQLEAGTSEEVSMLASSGGWGRVREVVWSLYPKLSEIVVAIYHAGTLQELLDSPVFNFKDDLMDSIRSVVHLFYREDADQLLEECPVGMLSVSILTRFMETFYGDERPFFESISDLVWSFSQRLLEGTFFLPTEAVLKLMTKSVAERWWENLKQRESRAEPVTVARFPFGRAFHEMGFADVLASGWPLFGYLELASVIINRLEKAIVSDGSDSAAKKSPQPALLVWPKPSCQFRSLGTDVSTVQLQDWSAGNLRQADHVQRSVTASTWELVFDADVCGVLAVAIAKFHAAKTQFGNLPKVVERIPLRNQTFVLPRNLEQDIAQDPELRCFVTHVRTGDASNHIYDFHVPCGIEIVNQAGTAWLQVSRKVLGKRSLRQVGEGERLWRSYVQKYGLLSAVSIMHYKPLLPDGLSNGFGDLHALQEELLVN